MAAERLRIAPEIMHQNDAARLHQRFGLAEAGGSVSEGFVLAIDDHHIPLAPSEWQAVTGGGEVLR